MLQRLDDSRVASDGSVLVKGSGSNGDRNGGKPKKWCKKCNKPWHTVETCREIHGRPAHLKKKSGGSNQDGGALQTSSDDSGQQSSISELVPFTKDQLELLLKMFKSVQISPRKFQSLLLHLPNRYIFLSKCCEFEVSTPLGLKTPAQQITWLVIPNFFPPMYHGPVTKRLNWWWFVCRCCWQVLYCYFSILTLKNVLHVPLLSYNLLFGSQITLYLHSCVLFVFSLWISGFGLGYDVDNARQDNGLYIFHANYFLDQQTRRHVLTPFLLLGYYVVPLSFGTPEF